PNRAAIEPKAPPPAPPAAGATQQIAAPTTVVAAPPAAQAEAAPEKTEDSEKMAVDHAAAKPEPKAVKAPLKKTKGGDGKPADSKTDKKPTGAKDEVKKDETTTSGEPSFDQLLKEAGVDEAHKKV